MTEKGLTKFIHSRLASTLMFIIVAAASLFAVWMDLIPDFTIETRSLFTNPGEWFKSPIVSWLADIGVCATCCAVLIFISRNYNPFRLSSSVAPTIFLALLLGSPATLKSFYSGTYILAVVVMCIVITLSEYQDSSKIRRVFLTFFILSAGGIAEYSLLLYIPVFMIGTAQMRIFSGKTFIAMLLGIITPFWILAGFGFLSFADFRLPAFESVFNSFSRQEIIPFVVSGIITFFFSVLLLMMNFLKMVGYNARIRSANGLMTATLLATLVYMVLDYRNFPAYIPLMMWGAAFQGGHLLMSKNGQRTYIAVIGIVILYLYLFIWSILA